MIMRLAEEWVLSMDVPPLSVREVRVIRAIQADALRYAANMTGDLKNVYLLKEADELDPQGKPEPV